MRVAILGAGGWGRQHVRTFCSLLGESAVVVCDPSEARLEEMLAIHPGIETSLVPTYKKIDAVVVAAPVALHFRLTQEALEAGKHVLVEKPIALSVVEAEHLVRQADARGRILMVDHLLEYHPAVECLKELIDQGELGKLLHLHSERLNLGVIRTEENAMWSLAPHDISVILHLLGEEPCSIDASGAPFLQAGIHDVAHVTMRFPSSAIAYVHVSWIDPVKTRSLTIVGVEGMAKFDDTAKDKLVYYPHSARRTRDGFTLRQREVRLVDVPDDEPLRRVAEEFLRCIEHGYSPRADGVDGLRVVRVLEAAQAAIQRADSGCRLGENA